MLALIPMLNIYRARYHCYMLKMNRLMYPLTLHVYKDFGI